ncbi:hypothetical protein [Streptomyces sudanensis]|uniref:hypothetical protein n=1 Tax=Streptomyces sudanensis TaxID=436397 RepID=UPI0020CBFC61|nr:hypothetical protein [Streptomyces sudanensis]MCP9956799.1 hypothetical protein [Streptomyces sudanensis]MCQ0002612.1 hypothetical protein [Streptomyces sudanensis]
MDWWIRVRRVPAVCASLTACLVLGAVADSIQVPVPVMVGGLSFSFPLPFLLPLAPVCLILYGQSRGGSATEVTAARPVGLWDTGFMTVCTAVMLAGGWLVSSMTGHILAVGMARNFLGYLGLALLLRLFTGPHVAAAVVTLFPIACAAFGVHHGTPARWAWPLHEPAYLPAFIGAAFLGAAGLATAAVPFSAGRLSIRSTSGSGSASGSSRARE